VDEALKRRLVGAFVLLAATFALASVLPDRAPVPAGEGERVVTYDLETGNEVIAVNGAAAVDPPPAPPSEPAPRLRLKSSESLSTLANPPEAQAPPAAPADAAASEWFVQIGSFGNQDNARAVVQKLRRKDWPVALEPIQASKGVLYRVRVGPYASEERGRTVLASLGKEGFREARLVKE